MDDRRLLEDFVVHRSETGFRAITDQYLKLVYSTALRITNDPHAAEDVTQAVFILLARKAESLPKKVLLAGWLYRTTHFVASRAVRSELRRQRREQEAFQMQQHEDSDDAWKNMAPLLDDALGRLREADRDVIVLRFFQSEPIGKIGEKLGISEEAAAKRISRALDALRGFFGRRGFAVTAGMLGATLAKHSTHAAPVPLAQSVVTSVFLHAPSTATAHYVLVQETLKAWQWAKAKWLLGLGAAATATIFWVAHSVPATHHGELAAQSKMQMSAMASSRIDSGGNGASHSETITTTSAAIPGSVFNFQAVDGVTGKGLAGAKVWALAAQDPQHIDLKTNLVTDALGHCDVPLVFPNSLGIVIGVIADGYEQRCVVAGANGPMPDGWVLKLSPGGTIGGVVQDESGRPVANADILIQFQGTGDSSAREFQRERPGFPADDIAVATTDAFGRWQFRSAPATNGDFYLNVRHPQFPVASFENDAENRILRYDNLLTMESLRAGRAVMVLKSGLRVAGIMTDDQQNPISGAQVRFGEFLDDKSSIAVTDDKGAFTLSNLKPGKGHITITAKGFAPERLAVDVKSNPQPVTVALKPAAQLLVRVVDEESNAIPNVDVRLQGWRGNNTLEWGGMTDDEGRTRWDSAPVDQLDVSAGRLGYFYSRANLIVADGKEHIIEMRKELVVSGWAVDADTGQAITDFRAIPGAERHDLVHGTNGQYSVTFREVEPVLRVTIEADGYEPLTSEPIASNTNRAVWNAELKRPDPKQVVVGTVIFPDGTPATGAQVALCNSGNGVIVGRGKFSTYGDSGIKTADENGRFEFSVAQNKGLVAIIHPRGFATLDLTHAARPLAIQLQPWGRIEGSLRLRGETNARQDIVLMSAQNVAGIHFDLGAFTTKTDESGNFVFDQAPPGAANLFVSLGVGIPFSHETAIVVAAGATIQAQIGGTGAAIKGKFVLSDPTRRIDWSKQVSSAIIFTKLPPVSPPENLRGEQRAQWLREYNSSAEGVARMRNSHSFPLNISADGSFSVVDVPPGEYSLNALFTKDPVDRSIYAGRPTPILGSARRDLTITDLPDAKEVDLGTLTVQVR